MNSFIETARGTPQPWSQARIFEAKIRRNIKLAECPGFGQSILKYDSQSNGAADYRALAGEIMEMETAAAKPVLTVNTAIDPTCLAAAGRVAV